ncbi:MAG: DUF58 domain-containing protein [Planctomycetaceae bacterium]
MTPRLNLLLLIALAGVPLVAGIWIRGAGPVGVLLTIAVVLLALVDLAISPALARIGVSRETGDVLSVGARNPVKIRLNNRTGATVTVEVHDEPPSPCTNFDLPFHITLEPGAHRYMVYHTQPRHRGRSRFGVVYLRCVSRLSFWELYDERDLEQPVKIYPDIKAVYGVELLARQNRLAEAGVRMSRLRGRGNEFDRLRDYRREDEYRDIDWKATARHQALISRDYVVEKNQNILFLLDCGRSMCNEQDGITHFDRALNAAILLSYVALRQGDTVGMLACSNRVERWVRPVRGTAGTQTLIRHTYDLEPTYQASDYGLMVEELRRRYRKRSLVVLLTHAIDEVHMNLLAQHARELRSPHLLLVALLQNVPLHERVNSIPQADIEAFQIAAAAEMAASQSLEAARLEKSGVLVIDTLPEQFSSRLISRYLDIKARHLL